MKRHLHRLQFFFILPQQELTVIMKWQWHLSVTFLPASIQQRCSKKSKLQQIACQVKWFVAEGSTKVMNMRSSATLHHCCSSSTVVKQAICKYYPGVVASDKLSWASCQQVKSNVLCAGHTGQHLHQCLGDIRSCSCRNSPSG